MIPESKFYTPQVSRSGKYIYYRFPTKWTTGETCAIEPTKSGAVITFPGTGRACTRGEAGTADTGSCGQRLRQGYPVCKYRLDRHETGLEIVWRYEK